MGGQMLEVGTAYLAESAIRGDVLEQNHLNQPKHSWIRFVGRQTFIEDVTVQCDKITPYIQLQIPGMTRAICSNLPHECPQTLHTLVDPLVLSARVRVVDKSGLPTRFQVAHKEMMHHPIPKIRSKYLPLFWFFNQKDHGSTGNIGPATQILVKGQHILFQILLE